MVPTRTKRNNRTRGSPDLAQPPSSSNSSTTSSTSSPRRTIFWPMTWLHNKSSSSHSRGSGGAGGLKAIEISRPVPLQRNGAPASVVASGAPASDLASNLVGQYAGFTLSPLTEDDSSFDSVDSETPPPEYTSVVAGPTLAKPSVLRAAPPPPVVLFLKILL